MLKFVKFCRLARILISSPLKKFINILLVYHSAAFWLKMAKFDKTLHFCLYFSSLVLNLIISHKSLVSFSFLFLFFVHFLKSTTFLRLELNLKSKHSKECSSGRTTKASWLCLSNSFVCSSKLLLKIIPVYFIGGYKYKLINTDKEVYLFSLNSY